MTSEEAIDILKGCELNPCVPKDKQATEMAIKALELVQAIKDLMDAEATWIFDEDGNDWHVILFEDLEEVLK